VPKTMLIAQIAAAD